MKPKILLIVFVIESIVAYLSESYTKKHRKGTNDHYSNTDESRPEQQKKNSNDLTIIDYLNSLVYPSDGITNYNKFESADIYELKNLNNKNSGVNSNLLNLMEANPIPPNQYSNSEILHLLEGPKLNPNRKHEKNNRKKRFNNNSGHISSLTMKFKSSKSELNLNEAANKVNNITSATNNNNQQPEGFWFKIRSTAFLNKIQFPDRAQEYSTSPYKFDDEGFLQNFLNNFFYFYFRVNKAGVYFTAQQQSFDIIEFFKLSDSTFSLESINGYYSCIKIKSLGILYDICQISNSAEHQKDMELLYQLEPQTNSTTPKLSFDILDFYCRILTYTNCTSDPYCNTTNNNTNSNSTNNPFTLNTTTVNNITVQPIIFVPIPTKPCNLNWNYLAAGADWECFCKEGQFQSPINIATAEVSASPVKPYFHFEIVKKSSNIKSSDGEVFESRPLKMKLRKNTFHISAFFGKIVKPDSSVYHCQELFLHLGSEHTLNSKQADLELQLQCNGKSVGDVEKKVMLVFLFTKKPGEFNPFLDDLDFFSLPSSEEEDTVLQNDLFIPKLLYSSGENPTVHSRLKPFSFYSYEGSLSYPPCVEKVTYYVVAEDLKVSNSVVELVAEAVRAGSGSGSSSIGRREFRVQGVAEVGGGREVQPMNGRVVYYWDKQEYCSDAELGMGLLEKRVGRSGREKGKLEGRFKEGHFEKVTTKRTDYIFVKGQKPSELPNSYVVTKEEALGVEKKLSEEDLKDLSLY